jgi:hypothetical protein
MVSLEDILKSLLERASMQGMKHVDCTYKIIKNGFSLLVFGVTDMEHNFSPSL